MSVYYKVKEHISTNNFHDDTITSAIIDTLVAIGQEMLYDRAMIEELTLHVNGHKYFFKGSEITSKFHEIIRAIYSANTMELIMSYESVNCVFPIANSVSAIFKEGPRYANNLFYSLYSKADCSSGVGLLSAYGEKNGKFYCGPIEPRPVSFVDGEWYNEDTLVAFEADIADTLNLANLKNCVDGLSAIGADIDFRVGDKDVSLFVNNIIIKTSEALERFVKYCIELDSVTNGRCGFMLEFVDTSAADVRVLQIELDDNGAYSVWMANV